MRLYPGLFRNPQHLLDGLNQAEVVFPHVPDGYAAVLGDRLADFYQLFLIGIATGKVVKTGGKPDGALPHSLRHQRLHCRHFPGAGGAVDKAHGFQAQGVVGHGVGHVKGYLLVEIGEYARSQSLPLHIHLSETIDEVDSQRREAGLTPPEYLDKLGMLENNRVLAAHCVWLTKGDIELLAKHSVSVLHCPSSNLKMGSGVANIPELLRAGINVCIGTDGNASNNNLDLIEEAMIAGLIQKGHRLDPCLMPVEDLLDMATINGARAMGLEKITGSIEPGKSADLIIIDAKNSEMQPINNPLANVFYSSGNKHVDTVMVNGNILLLEGEFTMLDEEKIINDANLAAEKLIAQWESERE